MKNIILALIAFLLLNSCSKPEDSNSPNVYYELVPIKRCIMPYSFTAGETYDLQMFYRPPTSCHFYKGLYFEKQGNTRIVAIQCGVVQRDDCRTLTYEGENMTGEQQSTTCEFTPTADQDSYTFRFWSGKNAQGEDTYYEVTVPVYN